MTTERQSAANRRNAKASTGPRTAAGKRKVAQNARRHGLTAPAPWDVVTNWYRLIINAPMQSQIRRPATQGRERPSASQKPKRKWRELHKQNGLSFSRYTTTPKLR